MGRETSKIVLFGATLLTGIGYYTYSQFKGTPETNEKAASEPETTHENQAEEVTRNDVEAKQAADEKLELEKTKKELAEMKEKESATLWRNFSIKLRIKEAATQFKEFKILTVTTLTDKAEAFLNSKLNQLTKFIKEELLDDTFLSSEIMQIDINKPELMKSLGIQEQQAKKEISSYIKDLKERRETLQGLAATDTPKIKDQLFKLKELLMLTLEKTLQPNMMRVFIALLTRDDEKANTALELVHDKCRATRPLALKKIRQQIEKGHNDLTSTLKIDSADINHINLYGILAIHKTNIVTGIIAILQNMKNNGALIPVLCYKFMKIKADIELSKNPPNNQTQDQRNEYDARSAISGIDIHDNGSVKSGASESTSIAYSSSSRRSVGTDVDIQTKYNIFDNHPLTMINEFEKSIDNEIKSSLNLRS